MSGAKQISLLGDSVLDNFIWLQDPKQDLRQQLSNIMPNCKVYNFAVDESRVLDILNGVKPRDVYQMGRKQYFKGNYDYPVSQDGLVYPLQLLKNVNTVQQLQDGYTVLSIGGNDGRVNLSDLVWGEDYMIDNMIKQGFVTNFEKLVKKTMAIQPNLILVFCYKPYYKIFDGYKQMLVPSYLQWLPLEGILGLSEKLNRAYDKIREIMIKIAQKYRLPVIDLSQTFDPYDPTYYGKGHGDSPIEPSNKSSMIIAHLIKRVVTKHDFGGNTIIYYSKPNTMFK